MQGSSREDGMSTSQRPMLNVDDLEIPDFGGGTALDPLSRLKSGEGSASSSTSTTPERLSPTPPMSPLSKEMRARLREAGEGLGRSPLSTPGSDVLSVSTFFARRRSGLGMDVASEANLDFLITQSVSSLLYLDSPPSLASSDEGFTPQVTTGGVFSPASSFSGNFLLDFLRMQGGVERVDHDGSVRDDSPHGSGSQQHERRHYFTDELADRDESSSQIAATAGEGMGGEGHFTATMTHCPESPGGSAEGTAATSSPSGVGVKRRLVASAGGAVVQDNAEGEAGEGGEQERSVRVRAMVDERESDGDGESPSNTQGYVGMGESASPEGTGEAAHGFGEARAQSDAGIGINGGDSLNGMGDDHSPRGGSSAHSEKQGFEDSGRQGWAGVEFSDLSGGGGGGRREEGGLFGVRENAVQADLEERILVTEEEFPRVGGGHDEGNDDGNKLADARGAAAPEDSNMSETVMRERHDEEAGPARVNNEEEQLNRLGDEGMSKIARSNSQGIAAGLLEADLLTAALESLTVVAGSEQYVQEGASGARGGAEPSAHDAVDASIPTAGAGASVEQTSTPVLRPAPSFFLATKGGEFSPESRPVGSSDRSTGSNTDSVHLLCSDRGEDTDAATRGTLTPRGDSHSMGQGDASRVFSFGNQSSWSEEDTFVDVLETQLEDGRKDGDSGEMFGSDSPLLEQELSSQQQDQQQQQQLSSDLEESSAPRHPDEAISRRPNQRGTSLPSSRQASSAPSPAVSGVLSARSFPETSPTPIIPAGFLAPIIPQAAPGNRAPILPTASPSNLLPQPSSSGSQEGLALAPTSSSSSRDSSKSGSHKAADAANGAPDAGGVASRGVSGLGEKSAKKSSPAAVAAADAEAALNLTPAALAETAKTSEALLYMNTAAGAQQTGNERLPSATGTGSLGRKNKFLQCFRPQVDE
eukprot:TRINITY_DN17106_c0_g1_i1.p1 TRINITY_DN17106_c0_g1~~TRINITY_DN17106_c0_g1_i1.p1  ORF type:complete len:929 (-),score=215.16 TRINITY_DN17106_c0_g1_i1:1165-3951(-)